MRQALVEHHRDVRAELRLNVGRLLRRQRVRRPVEMRSEVRPVLVDRPPRGEAEHLIPAAVGQDRLRPADEPVEPAPAGDEIVAGPQIQVIGVAQQDLGADRFEIAVRDAFHGALRPDRHERRRLDVAVGGGHDAAARAAVRVCHAKVEAGADIRRS